MTSGTVVSNTTVQASPATMKTQNGIPATWHSLGSITAGHGSGCTGWDLNNGTISPKKPLSSLVYIQSSRQAGGGEGGMITETVYEGIGFSIDSEYQSKYDSCSRVHVKIDNVSLRIGDSDSYSNGYIEFDIMKSEAESYSSRYCTSNLLVDRLHNYSAVIYNGSPSDSFSNSTLLDVLGHTSYINQSIQVTVTFV